MTGIKEIPKIQFLVSSSSKVNGYFKKTISNLTLHDFQRHRVLVLDRPACSPDLSPSENGGHALWHAFSSSEWDEIWVSCVLTGREYNKLETLDIKDLKTCQQFPVKWQEETVRGGGRRYIWWWCYGMQHFICASRIYIQLLLHIQNPNGIVLRWITWISAFRGLNSSFGVFLNMETASKFHRPFNGVFPCPWEQLLPSA